MTGHPPAGPGGPHDLPARVLRAPFRGFDLPAAGGIHVAVLTSTACFAARSRGEIAGQISTRQPPVPHVDSSGPAGPRPGAGPAR